MVDQLRDTPWARPFRTEWEGEKLFIKDASGRLIYPHEMVELLNATQSETVQAIPKGWRLVPEGPTPEMVEAAVHCLDGVNIAKENGNRVPLQLRALKARRRYAAMLAAAPQPNAATQASGLPEHSKDSANPALAAPRAHSKSEYKRLTAQGADVLPPVEHVCGLQGYNPMIDPPCPGCEARRTHGKG